MRREGQSRGLGAERGGARKRRADDGTMTAVHAIEVADRHDRAIKRARITIANDGKGLGRRHRVNHVGSCIAKKRAGSDSVYAFARY